MARTNPGVPSHSRCRVTCRPAPVRLRGRVNEAALECKMGEGTFHHAIDLCGKHTPPKYRGSGGLDKCACLGLPRGLPETSLDGGTRVVLASTRTGMRSDD